MMPSLPKPRHTMQPQLLPCMAHLDSVSTLNCEMRQRRVENAKLLQRSSQWPSQACPPEDLWALMYPLQPLTGSIPLVPLLGMPAAAQLQAATTQVPSQHLSPWACQTLQHLSWVLNDGAVPLIKVCLTQGKMKRNPLMTHLKSTPQKVEANG